jgi:hypothetical protein
MSCFIRSKAPPSLKLKWYLALSRNDGEALLQRSLGTIAYHRRRAVIKTAATEGQKMCLRREYHNYGFSEIASSPVIRALRDTVWSNEERDNPSCLVFEWMDQDLESVIAPKFRGSEILPKVVSKAVLSALSVLKTLGAVHTGRGFNVILILVLSD